MDEHRATDEQRSVDEQRPMDEQRSVDERRQSDAQRPAWYAVPAVEKPAPGSPLDRLREHPPVATALGLVVALAIALGGVWVAASASSPQVELGPIAGGSAGDATPEAGTLVVDVAGAVRSPGLYRLPVGARVGDAISAAGGFGPAVDTAAVSAGLNLAATLSDAQKIVVPARGAATTAPSGGSAGNSAGLALVDVNHASQAELEALPGIGPATAQKIIAARAERPFASAHELLDRKLVGNATWEKIRDLVTAG
jgi:competence protein ComEA